MTSITGGQPTKYASLRILLSGFSKERAVAQLVTTKLQSYGIRAEVVVPSDYFKGEDFYGRNPVAAVAMEKREIAGCDFLLVDFDNGKAESLTHMMFAWSMEKGVVGVTTTYPPGGWVTCHCVGVLPTLEEALDYLGTFASSRSSEEST